MMKSKVGLNIQSDEHNMVLHAVNPSRLTDRPEMAVTCHDCNHMFLGQEAQDHLDAAGVISVGNWTQLIPSGATYEQEA